MGTNWHILLVFIFLKLISLIKHYLCEFDMYHNTERFLIHKINLLLGYMVLLNLCLPVMYITFFDNLPYTVSSFPKPPEIWTCVTSDAAIQYMGWNIQPVVLLNKQKQLFYLTITCYWIPYSYVHEKFWWRRTSKLP